MSAEVKIEDCWWWIQRNVGTISVGPVLLHPCWSVFKETSFCQCISMAPYSC